MTFYIFERARLGNCTQLDKKGVNGKSVDIALVEVIIEICPADTETFAVTTFLGGLGIMTGITSGMVRGVRADGHYFATSVYDA